MTWFVRSQKWQSVLIAPPSIDYWIGWQKVVD
jgi:hypothetical protein